MRDNEAARRCRNVLLTLSIALYAASFLLPATISNRGGHTDPGFVLFFAAFLYFPYGLVSQLPNVFLWTAFAAMADGRPGRAAGYSLAGVPFAGAGRLRNDGDGLLRVVLAPVHRVLGVGRFDGAARLGMPHFRGSARTGQSDRARLPGRPAEEELGIVRCSAPARPPTPRKPGGYMGCKVSGLG